MFEYIALTLLFVVLVFSKKITGLFTMVIRNHMLADMRHRCLASANGAE